MFNYFHAIIFEILYFMDKKGYTTESGGRQNGFAMEPEINVISEGESKKSLIIFSVIFVSLILVFVYYLKGYWLIKKVGNFN